MTKPKHEIGDTVWVTMLGTVTGIENKGTRDNPIYKYTVMYDHEGMPITEMAFVTEKSLAGEEAELLKP